MPDDPKLPPPTPDALRKPQPTAAPAPRRTLPRSHDPLNPVPVQPQQPAEDDGEEDEKQEKQSSGLGQMDATHVFSGALVSMIARPLMVVVSTMLAHGLTEACEYAQHLINGWLVGGSVGVLKTIIAALAAPSAGSGWFADGDSTTLSVVYLMFVLGGLILAVRSEIHIVKMCFFYFVVASIHALFSSGQEMKNPVSFTLWAGMLVGSVWLYRWYWKQQEPDEEAGGEGEDEEKPEA